MRKKWLSLLAIAVLSLSVAACGGKDAEKTDASSNVEEKDVASVETEEESEVESEKDSEIESENGSESDLETESETYEEYYWPVNGIAKILPLPESKVGVVAWDEKDSFSIEIAQTTKEQYEKYIDACLESGFDADYSRYSETFYAYDKGGYDLTVCYLDGDKMWIKLEAPKQ